MYRVWARRAFVAALLYEAVAITTDASPTLSEIVWSLPLPARVVVGGALGAGFFDHLVTRRYL